MFKKADFYNIYELCFFCFSQLNDNYIFEKIIVDFEMIFQNSS